MTFEELVDQAIAMLERRGRVTCRVLKRQFQLDDDVDYSAIGQTTSLAARMEQLAPPGTMRLAAETLRLVGGWVQVTPRRAFPPPQPSPASKEYNSPPARRVPNRMAHEGQG